MSDYPRRLHHQTPSWVKDGALFHLRLRAEPAQIPLLTDPNLGRQLLAAAQRYHGLGRWWCELFLLMPDHAHAMVAFPDASGMSATVRDWKRGTARYQRVQWQSGYFDHRIRHDKEGAEIWHYICRNPVVKGLCAGENDWPWWWSALNSTS